MCRMWRWLLPGVSSAHLNLTWHDHSDSSTVARLVQNDWYTKTLRRTLMSSVLFAYMAPEVFYIHKHCSTKTHSCCVVASFVMGLCSSLISNLADLDEWGWQCSRVTGVFSHSFLPACLTFFISLSCLSFSIKAHMTVHFLPGPAWACGTVWWRLRWTEHLTKKNLFVVSI